MNDSRIEVIYEKGQLERFRKEILAGHYCDLFLPASFIDSDGATGACYDTTGYERLVDLIDIKASTLINVVKSILDKSGAAERRLFFTGEYSLERKYVYVKRTTEEAGLIYRSSAQQTKGEILKSLRNILNIGTGKSGSGRKYLEKAEELLMDARVGYALISRRLGRIGEEAYRSGS